MTVVTNLLAPAAGTPPCGPPVLDPATGWTVTRHADVRAALLDPACQVPVAPPGPPGTLAWLRGTVSRFSAPETHPGRRAAGTAMLAGLDPDELREVAARRTGETLDRAADRLDVMAALARRVPLRVLAERLGLADPDAAVPAVTAVAAAYHPGADPATVRRADRAVAALLALTPADAPEVRANRIGLLVQAADATAGLIGAATRHVLARPADVPTGDLAEVLRLDPPVRGTRRVTIAPVRLGGRKLASGSPVLLRFDAANRDPAVFADPDHLLPGRPHAALTFGAGPRGCPGERHALALATGVVDVLRRRCRPVPAPVPHEPHVLLRVPIRLEVHPR
ncbi:Cytochrome P450 [Micromonospora echinaurantiaca]|uniref:Cytochrome P450 n=1 Tax=Micromonospora echinaurantiaca TaxID=47857 RepID=A0A1C5HYL0_9ACTN|nr:cytochrome P450 [Micromonospora echinaurantiaca]SCG51110.1 Cytochrome P450 [Micromonospora echinaurantiaca]